MKRIIIFLLPALFLSLALTACDNITEQSDVTPGGRNFKWAVDTILTNTYYGPYGNDGKIFGTGMQDLWYLCSSAGELWEYGSGNWSRVNFTGFYPSKIFQSGNRFIVISQGLRYCIYNGASFGEIRNMGLPDQVYIYDMYGESINDIYAVGEIYKNSMQKGVLLHFNGTIWTETETDYIGSFTGISKGSNSGILINYNSNFGDSGILEYDGRAFKRIADYSYSSFLLGGKIFMRQNNYLYKYNEGKIYSWRSISSITSNLIFGRSESDMFFMNYYGLMHYNGEDTALLYPTSNLHVLDGRIIGNMVCCLTYDDNYSQVKLIIGTYK